MKSYLGVVTTHARGFFCFFPSSENRRDHMTRDVEGQFGNAVVVSDISYQTELHVRLPMAAMTAQLCSSALQLCIFSLNICM